jgi:hypothetical protein
LTSTRSRDESKADQPLFTRSSLAVSAGVLIVFAVALHLIGRIAWGKHGFGLWTWEARGSDTSQLFADPYSITHMTHGVIFFGILWPVRDRIPLPWRFLISLVLEAGWELVENSPFVIERFRAATASLDYTGDTILNSVGDVLFCQLGFCLAAKLPWKWTVAFVAFTEVGLLFLIRDNFTLNVLMLLYPIQAIKDWQMAR